MSHQLKCHFRDMQPAEILCAISQLNAEIAERQSELERLKQLYTEKANADIQFALKALTGQGQPISRSEEKASPGSWKKVRNKPYERRSPDDSAGPSTRPLSARTDPPGMSNTGKVQTVLNKVNYRVY